MAKPGEEGQTKRQGGATKAGGGGGVLETYYRMLTTYRFNSHDT